MRRPRRTHAAEFNAKVTAAALMGDKTLAELAEKFNRHTNQITQWRTQLLEGATDVSLSPAAKRETGPSTAFSFLFNLQERASVLWMRQT